MKKYIGILILSCCPPGLLTFKGSVDLPTKNDSWIPSHTLHYLVLPPIVFGLELRNRFLPRHTLHLTNFLTQYSFMNIYLYSGFIYSYYSMCCVYWMSIKRIFYSSTPNVLGMTLNCIHIFIVTGSFLYWCVIWLASQRFFIHSFI